MINMYSKFPFSLQHTTSTSDIIGHPNKYFFESLKPNGDSPETRNARNAFLQNFLARKLGENSKIFTV